MNTIRNLDKTLELSNNVKKICSPIFKLLDLNFFRFMRVYNDLSRITLTTNNKWTEHFYSNGLDKIAWFDKHGHGSYKSAHVLWDNKMVTDDNIVGKTSREKYDLHHGFTIIRTSSTWTEFYDFTTYDEKGEINNLYIYYPELFQRFAFYFKDQARQLIKILEQQKNKVRLPVPEKKNNAQIAPLSSSQIKEFINITPINRYYFDDYAKKAYLTEREVACIYGCLAGNSAEEIGFTMNISKRTVEGHLDSIKKKLGCIKLSEAIKKVMELGIIDGYRMPNLPQDLN